jgi:hypothetical protein
VPIMSAGYLSGNTASHFVTPSAMGGMAAVYALDICSGISGICGPLPERLAPGVVKEPAGFFNNFFIVCYFWSGFGCGCYAIGGGMFNRGPDEGDGRKLTSS